MLQPTIQNIKWEQLNFLGRVYGDLEVADGFIGMTKEQMFMAKASEALNSSLKQLLVALLDELPKEKYNLITEKRRLTYSDVDSAYNLALSEFTKIINKKIEEL